MPGSCCPALPVRERGGTHSRAPRQKDVTRMFDGSLGGPLLWMLEMGCRDTWIAICDQGCLRQ